MVQALAQHPTGERSVYASSIAAQNLTDVKDRSVTMARYEIAFSAELVPGAQIEAVKTNLAKLFQADAARHKEGNCASRSRRCPGQPMTSQRLPG